MTDARIRTIAGLLSRFPPTDSDMTVAIALLDDGHFPDLDEEELARLVAAARGPLMRPAPDPVAAARPEKPRTKTGRTHHELHRAAYRFVPLNETILNVDPADLDLPLEGGLCGTLEVDWVVDTPLLIGAERDGIVQPTQVNRRYVIPGASLRGLIRSVVEAASLSALGKGNHREVYSFRDFNREDYKALTRPENIRAGWLSLQDGVWSVLPTQDEGKGWGVVEVEALAAAGVLRIDGQSEISRRRAWAGLDRTGKSRRLTGSVDAHGRRSIKVGREPSVYDVGRFVPRATGQEAVLVVSGRQPDQKDDRLVRRHEYVFLPEASAAPRTITPEAWERFELANCRQGAKGPVPDGAWRELEPRARAGDWIPVFWIGDLERQGEGFALGLTRLFKVPHAHSVGQVAARTHSAHRRRPVREGEVLVDFADALFGHVIEEDELDGPAPAHAAVARRGRLAFGFATALEGDFHLADRVVDTVTMAPKPSFAPFYLVGDDRDWSDPKAQLAGRKRYLPRYPDPRASGTANRIADSLRGELAAITQTRGTASPEVGTRLRFLEPTRPGESRFRSQIRFHNASPEQVGALVWALTFGGRETHRHMLGRARAHGAGQLKAVPTRIRGAWNDGRPLADGDILVCRQAFEALMTPWWRQSGVVEDLLASADPGRGEALAEAGGLTPLRLRENVDGKTRNPFVLLRQEGPNAPKRTLSLNPRK